MKSNCNIEIKALVIPHPKHFLPKILYMGQSEALKIFVKKYSAINNAIPSNMEKIRYLCCFKLYVILCQRLTITISKATGQYGY